MNIVLLILDALRYDYVNHENTPNLMKLAEEGAYFTNASSGNSSTIVSMPYILSGQKNFDPQRNIAALLNTAGLHTALIHSNPMVHEFYPGFKETIDIKSSRFRMSKSWKRTLRNNLPPQVIAGMKKIRATFYEDDDYLPYARSHETIEFSLKWMRDHSDYFIWIQIMEPHSPYYPMNTSLNMTQQEIRNLNDKLIESVHGNYEPTSEEIKKAKTLYAEDIKEMDHELGFFFNSLDKDDLLVVTADHGEEFGEHGQYSHHADKFIPELIHVPLIISGENVKAGLVIDKPVSTMSIGQTIMDSLGVDQKLSDGVSLWGLVKA